MALTRWIAVHCQNPACKRVNLHATPGSCVRFRCKRCKRLQSVEV